MLPMETMAFLSLIQSHLIHSIFAEFFVSDTVLGTGDNQRKDIILKEFMVQSQMTKQDMCIDHSQITDEKDIT